MGIFLITHYIVGCIIALLFFIGIKVKHQFKWKRDIPILIVISLSGYIAFAFVVYTNIKERKSLKNNDREIM